VHAPEPAETRAARRERIASALYSDTFNLTAETACDWADQLIDELDRRAALDAESAKGGAS
jgi:hypothetical protein